MGAEATIHDESLQDKQLRELALFSLMTEETAPDLSTRKLVRGLEIFRAGTFKDSKGVQKTWGLEDLQLMADNFAKLRADGKFPNVPVRTDHSSSVLSIVGYIDSLTVVGDRLVADVEFTEPDHLAKFDRGTYRGRSIEISKYEDNEGNEYWPAVMGLAFVDLPAVEGLHRKPAAVAHFRFQDGKQEEPPVPDKDDKSTQPFTFRIAGADETDYSKVQAHVVAIEGENAALKTRNEALETFAKEQVKNTRHHYVSGLAEAKKIAATQIDALKTLVEGMSDEQFEAFQKAYEVAPTISLLGNHGEGTTNPEGAPSGADDERQVLEEIVALHRKAQMSEEELAKTASFRKLAALNGQK